MLADACGWVAGSGPAELAALSSSIRKAAGGVPSLWLLAFNAAARFGERDRIGDAISPDVSGAGICTGEEKGWMFSSLAVDKGEPTFDRGPPEVAVMARIECSRADLANRSIFAKDRSMSCVVKRVCYAKISISDVKMRDIGSVPLPVLLYAEP